METTLTAMSAAAGLALPFLPPIAGAEGTALSGLRIGAGAGLVPAATGLVAGATAPAYTPAFRPVTDSHTDATQVPLRGRPV